MQRTGAISEIGCTEAHKNSFRVSDKSLLFSPLTTAEKERESPI